MSGPMLKFFEPIRVFSDPFRSGQAPKPVAPAVHRGVSSKVGAYKAYWLPETSGKMGFSMRG
jgi:hypothetical protein